MSIVDTKELLGKRVTFNIDYGVAGYAPKCVTGLIVGLVTPLAGYEDMVGNEALFWKMVRMSLTISHQMIFSST